MIQISERDQLKRMMQHKEMSISLIKRFTEVYIKKKQLIIFFLGFSAGLPFLLIFSTLTAWLSQLGVDKTTIGLFVLTGSAFTLKFMWAPIVDSIPLPFLTNLLGQRRSWLFVSQLLCLFSLIGLGLSNPSSGLGLTILFALILAFSSATQDIVIDAFRIETLERNEQGAGAAMYQMGYRVALVAAGAGALILADSIGWVLTYFIMSIFMLVGILTVLFSSEPNKSGSLSKDINIDNDKLNLHKIGNWLRFSVVDPFKDFYTRPGWIIILLFIVFYKYADGIWGAMSNPFYLEVGFTLTEIGIISKSYGVFMTILGSIIGGVLVASFGILNSVLFGAIIMALTNLLYALLAFVGPSIPLLITVISIENISNGIGGTAFIAYLSSLCNLSYTATQYALLTSFMNLARTFLAAGGGWLADQFDWVTFFLITTIAGAPAVLLFLFLMKFYPDHIKQNDTK